MRMSDIIIQVNSLQLDKNSSFAEYSRIRLIQALQDYKEEKEREIRQLKRELSK